jgi:hypothetical protein
MSHFSCNSDAIQPNRRLRPNSVHNFLNSPNLGFWNTGLKCTECAKVAYANAYAVRRKVRTECVYICAVSVERCAEKCARTFQFAISLTDREDRRKKCIYTVKAIRFLQRTTKEQGRTQYLRSFYALRALSTHSESPHALRKSVRTPHLSTHSANFTTQHQ